METIRTTLESVMRDWEKKILKPDEDSPGVPLKKFLTKKELGHIRFRYFKKGVLSFNVDSSSWLYYFNLRKSELLAKLQKQTGLIKEIRFYIGEV
jgi:hypothetical protein